MFAEVTSGAGLTRGHCQSVGPEVRQRTGKFVTPALMITSAPGQII